jgi:hypothetical protein
MIGKIQEKNISVPLNATDSTRGDGSIEDPDYKKSSPSLGVATVRDGFEKTEQDNLLEKLGLNPKTVVDPIGYPGEEWLWENSEVQ